MTRDVLICSLLTSIYCPALLPSDTRGDDTFEGSIPEEIGNLSSLKHLEMAGAALMTGTIPAGLYDLWCDFSNDWLFRYSRLMALLSSKKLEETTSKIVNLY